MQNLNKILVDPERAGIIIAGAKSQFCQPALKLWGLYMMPIVAISILLRY